MRPLSALSTIHQHIMWKRLISVVEEQAQALIRTAFSTSVREAGDLAAAVFDCQGRMLAQAVTGTPGHINSMAEGVLHFIKKHPVETMNPGDAFITNDPWMTSGHLHDITVLTPTFLRGRVIALFANTCHVVDIGGRGFGPDARQVYEEGLNIPILHLFHAGEPNKTLLDIIQSNVREPRQVLGDIFSFAASNEVGSKRLLKMMEEFKLQSLEELGEFIITHSRDATIKRIHLLKNGTYHNTLMMDGYDRPIKLQAAMTVSDDQIHIDYSGTSPAAAHGINVVLNYTKAYTCFGVKCVVAPDIPNNYGSLLPISFSAPEGCILNAQHPHPVAARHIIGHLLPDTILGCLHQVLEGGVQAEGSASLWTIQLRGGSSISSNSSYKGSIPEFEMLQFNSGGSGARPKKDGMSTTAFPSGVKGMPVEVNEAITPIIFWRKEFRSGSGGAGCQRGGLGQDIEIGGAEGIPFDVLAMYERCDNAPKGRNNGKDGATGRLSLASGPALRPKGQQSIPPFDRLRLELPGGAGFGDPFDRDPEKVAEDVRNEIISQENAQIDYGVNLNKDGSVNQIETRRTRSS
ncbi:MAG: hydantoinase B/oxoprolinase family protein [SAR324 cluster bacterium]|nr:hydantoinase B/oxoprolinase family protein [SAR324 cluster bacterium]